MAGSVEASPEIGPLLPKHIGSRDPNGTRAAIVSADEPLDGSEASLARQMQMREAFFVL
jgi:hypothetical protein